MDPLQVINEWLGRAPNARAVESRMRVATPVPGKYGRETVVRVSHTVRGSRRWPVGWQVTTRHQLLFEAHFRRGVRAVIAAAPRKLGRVLYFIDRGMTEVTAAISFELDDRPRIPIMLTAIGMRGDASAHPDLYDRSRAGAVVLLQYLHVLSLKVDRGGDLHIDLVDAACVPEVTALGFKQARPAPGLHVNGKHLRRLPPA